MNAISVDDSNFIPAILLDEFYSRSIQRSNRRWRTKEVGIQISSDCKIHISRAVGKLKWRKERFCDGKWLTSKRSLQLCWCCEDPRVTPPPPKWYHWSSDSKVKKMMSSSQNSAQWTRTATVLNLFFRAGLKRFFNAQISYWSAMAVYLVKFKRKRKRSNVLPNGISTSVIAWQNENLNRLPLGQTGEKNIALSEYNKNTSSRIDDYSNEQIPWQTLQRQWVIKRCVLRTCSRPTSGIPAYAATDLANESVPGPNNIIFFGSWVMNSWRTFCPKPKLPFGKKKFFSVITKNIALYLYDTSSLPSTWHDLYWLLCRWYKSPPSPMPCTMYV